MDKTKSILLLLTTLTITYSSVYAQFFVSIGPDIHWCKKIENPDSVQLFSNVSGGTPPYKYEWRINPIQYSSNITFYGSHFMTDTTMANPIIFNNYGYEMTFYLEVTDSNGVTCSDSLILTTSQFAKHLITYTFHINVGDSIRLNPPNVGLINSKPSIDSVVWRPKEGLNDSTAIQPWAKPTRDIVYSCEIWDSAGCSMEGDPLQYVYVSGLGQSPNPLSGLELYPTVFQKGQNSNVFLSGVEHLAFIEFRLYSANGALVHSGFPLAGKQTIKINLPSLKRGVYYYQINTSEHGHSRQGTIIVTY